ncbi:hypothetical protein TEPIDINF_001399 [Tepidibacillus infernus]
MLMYPKEYLDFSHLVKQYVILHIMLKVLEFDRKMIQQSACKLTRVYQDTLFEVQKKIEKDLRSIKRQMKELGGMVIEEEQQRTVRIVKAKFRGFIYTHRFLNYMLQAESEQLFKSYVSQGDDQKK